MRRREAIAVGATAALLSAITAVYRFNTLGGSLGGFDDDEFLFISRGLQILRGDLPVRDFPDPGAPLAYLASGVAIRLFGNHLGGEAVLAVAGFAATAALIFVLARHLSQSWVAAIVATLLSTAIAPRFYNYPKVLLYAAGLLLMWRYISYPSPLRAVWLAALAAVAALFRHDHGLYLGALGALSIALAHLPNWRAARTPLVVYAVACVCLLAPYLVFVQVEQGVVPYFRSALSWAGRDLSRTQLHVPRFAFDVAAPWYTVAAAEAPPRRRVKVRWREMADAERAALEQRYRLTPREQFSENAWDYEIDDTTPENLGALVKDPGVEDTERIDRTTFQHRDPEPVLPWWRALQRSSPLFRTSPLPGVFRAENAIPFLYYLVLGIPIAGSVMLLLRRSTLASIMPGVARPVLKVVVAIAMGALVDRGFLRGNLEARLPDVAAPIAVLGAWLAVAFLRSGAQRWYAARVAGVALVTLLAVAAVGANASVPTELEHAGLISGPTGLVERTREVWRELSQDPAAVAATGATELPMFALATYLRACTAPDDRVLMFPSWPALFFYADRGFAAGLIGVKENWLGSVNSVDRDIGLVEQQDAVTRLRSQRAPIAIADDDLHDAAPRDFPVLTAYIDAEYRVAGVAALSGERYQILIRRDAVVASRYPPLDLPCLHARP